MEGRASRLDFTGRLSRPARSLSWGDNHTHRKGREGGGGGSNEKRLGATSGKRQLRKKVNPDKNATSQKINYIIREIAEDFGQLSEEREEVSQNPPFSFSGKGDERGKIKTGVGEKRKTSSIGEKTSIVGSREKRRRAIDKLTKRQGRLLIKSRTNRQDKMDKKLPKEREDPEKNLRKKRPAVDAHQTSTLRSKM